MSVAIANATQTPADVLVDVPAAAVADEVAVNKAAVENATQPPADVPVDVPAAAVADEAAVNKAAVANNDAITPAVGETPANVDAVIEITSKAQFEALVKETPYVVLQAHAVWCGPCKAMTPLFKMWAKGLAEHQSTYTFARFDTDEIEDLARDLEIRSIPAFFFFEDGKTTPVNKFVGAQPKPLKEIVDIYAAKAKEASANKFSTDEAF